jgi:hypothetical protein
MTSDSPITVSNAVDGLTSLVRNGHLECADVLKTLCDRFLEAPASALESILFAISDLLVLSVQHENVHNHDGGFQSHPMVIAATVKPESLSVLPSVLERAFDLEVIAASDRPKHAQNVLYALEPFLDFIFLSGSVDAQRLSSSVTQILIRLIYRSMDESLVSLREGVLRYLLTVVQRASLAQDDGCGCVLIHTLVDMIHVSHIRTGLSSMFVSEYCVALDIQILALACNIRQKDGSESMLLRSRTRLVQSAGISREPDFMLLWPSLTFLLLNNRSTETCNRVLDFMLILLENRLKVPMNNVAHTIITSLAILPLFQVLCEVGPGATRTKALEVVLLVDKARAKIGSYDELPNREKVR